jgi:hypothetical protein
MADIGFYKYQFFGQFAFFIFLSLYFKESPNKNIIVINYFDKPTRVRKLQSTPLRMKNIGKYWRRVAKKSRKSLSRQGKVVILQADYYQGTQKSPIFSV